MVDSGFPVSPKEPSVFLANNPVESWHSWTKLEILIVLSPARFFWKPICSAEQMVSSSCLSMKSIQGFFSWHTISSKSAIYPQRIGWRSKGPGNIVAIVIETWISQTHISTPGTFLADRNLFQNLSKCLPIPFPYVLIDFDKFGIRPLSWLQCYVIFPLFNFYRRGESVTTSPPPIYFVRWAINHHQHVYHVKILSNFEKSSWFVMIIGPALSSIQYQN